MRIVDLADEFELTTAETLELCEHAGVAATGGGDEVSEAEAAAVRQLRLRGSSPNPWPSATGATPESARPLPPNGPAYAMGASSPGPFDETGKSTTEARSGAGSHLAVFGVAASLLGLCLPVVPAVVGIALGTIAKRRAAAAGNAARVIGPATAAQVLGVVFLVGWIAWFGWSYRSQRMTVALSDKTEVQVRRVEFDDVQSTDCLVIQPTNIVDELWVVECSEAHDAQVLSFREVSSYGVEPAEVVALAGCRTDARQSDLTDETLVVTALIPSVPSRTEFNQAICIVTSSDGRPLVGRR